MILQVVFAAILCTGIASNTSAPLQCYHCSVTTPEECTGSQNKTVKTCAANQTCGALVNFRNNSQELIQQFVLDCVDEEFCQGDQDACKGSFGGNCTRCCNCDKCNDATVNRTSRDISLNNTCPTPAPTPTPPFQCYHCSDTTQEECSEPGQTIVKNCNAGEVCRALVDINNPIFAISDIPETNLYQLGCVPLSACEVDNECKTERFGHRFGTCFGCCNCSLCNEPTVNLTVPDVSIETCPIPYPTPSPIPTPPPTPTPPVTCYSCSEENGTCTSASITDDHLVTCQINQSCYVRRNGDDTFTKGCVDKNQCTPPTQDDKDNCYACCEADGCNKKDFPDNFPEKCGAVTSSLSVLLLAIAGVVNYWLLMANHC